MLLLPLLRCGHDKVYIMTKLLPPGDRDTALLPNHCVKERMKRIIF